jgi:hypothetical protein
MVIREIEMNIKQAIEITKDLSSSEKALLAHCLISSLETSHDEDVDAAWASITRERFEALQTGEVEPVSWNEIIKDIRD